MNVTCWFVGIYLSLSVRDRIPVGRRFSARPERPWVPPSLLYNGYRVFPGGRGGRGVGLTPPHPHLVTKVLEKIRAIPLVTLRACVAYKRGENLPASLYMPIKNSATKQKCACLIYSDIKDLPSSRIHTYTPEASTYFLMDRNSLINFRRRPVNTRFTVISTACVIKL